MSLLLTLTAYIPVNAAESATGACTWKLDGTHLTISGNGKMADYAFSCGPWGKDITSVTIEDGVTSIGNYAFYDCGALASITIPDSVTAIGENVFENCTMLTAINLPEGIQRLELRTFAGCTALKSIDIPNSVKIIGIAAFDNCNSLTEITIPEGVTTIEMGAFVNCGNLRRISLPDSVTSIGEAAFRNTPALMDKANRYQGVVYFGNHAIEHIDPDYEEIHIREGTKTIASYAFDASNRLTAIAIPDSVTAIGGYAFSRCDHLHTVYYAGNESDKNRIQIAEGNASLLSATWHYGIAKIPATTAIAAITTTAEITTTATMTTTATHTDDTTSTAITDPSITESTTVPSIPANVEMKVEDGANEKHHSRGVIIGVSIGAAVILIAVILFFIIRNRKNNT